MRRPWLVIGLVASLALNLFLIGVGAGAFALARHLAAEGRAVRPAAYFWATQPLPQPDRHSVRLMLRQVHDEVKPDLIRSLALKTAAWSALAAPAPDVAAIDRQLAQSRQIDVAARGKVEDEIVANVARLSPADREIFAAGMRRQLTPNPAKR